MALTWKQKQSKWLTNVNAFLPESIERKNLLWEGPNFLKKHKLSSHENVFIEFENLDITGTSKLLVLKKGKNDWIDKIDIRKFSNVNKLYITTTWIKPLCVLTWRTV